MRAYCGRTRRWMAQVAKCPSTTRPNHRSLLHTARPCPTSVSRRGHCRIAKSTHPSVPAAGKLPAARSRCFERVVVQGCDPFSVTLNSKAAVLGAKHVGHFPGSPAANRPTLGVRSDWIIVFYLAACYRRPLRLAAPNFKVLQASFSSRFRELPDGWWCNIFSH